MRVTMTFTSGEAAMKAALAAIQKNIERKGKAASKAAAQFILEESNKKVPTDTEALMESGEVEEFGSGLDHEAWVLYGRIGRVIDKATPAGEPWQKYPWKYAWHIHEGFHPVSGKRLVFKSGEEKFLMTTCQRRTDIGAVYMSRWRAA